jgi:cbb3-type cytochrome c oxidase subunit III
MKISFFSFLIAASLLLAACSFSLAEDITPPPGSQQQAFVDTPSTPAATGPLYPLVAPNPESGAALYLEKCAPCHGTTGQGDGSQALQLPNPPTAIGSADVARLSTPAQWFNMVTRGDLERFMPPFHSLSDRQRWDVIAYVYSLSESPDMIALGQEIYAQSCAECHGETGRGNGPAAASLTASLPNFADQAYMAKLSGNDFFRATADGIGDEMPAFGNLLSEQELWSVSGYLRTLSFSSQAQLAAAPSAAAPSAAAPSAAAPSAAAPSPAAPEETEAPETEWETETATESEAEDELAVKSGTIYGVVSNGSGGDPMEGIPVTLHGFDGMEVVLTASTTTGPSGEFFFEDMALEENRVFIATAEFGEATYASPIATVQQGAQDLSLEIIAYETTTDTSALVADRLHIFLDFNEPGYVQISELYIMSNLSNETIVPESVGQPVVVFPLPENAENLQFRDGVLGDRYIEVPGGFADTVPLQPNLGEYQVLFAYDLPYDRRLDIRHPLNLPVDAVVILQPESGVKIRSDQLQDDGARPIQGVSYQMFSGGPFAAGDSLTLNLSGRAATGSGLAPAANESLIIGLGAFGTALIVAGFLMYRRSRRGDDLAEEDTGDEQVESEQDPDSLIDAIIALDDLYQAGELPEEAYVERRAELKDRLKNLTK